VIVRQLGSGGGDYILLPKATATGELLDAATRVLLHARVLQGERPATYRGRPATTVTIGVRPHKASQAWARTKIPLAQRVVDSLMIAPVRKINGVGMTRSVEFYPPRP
jgi:hypothetical protein